jgi:DNA-binding transcriptional MerR regulator
MTTSTFDQAARLPIQEVARRTGFSESTLRYYERIGLIDRVPRDQSSSHRRYASETVDTLEALACLRSTGMSIEDMRAYLEGVAEGRTAAPRMVELFAGHAQRLEDELAALRVRHAYATAKVALIVGAESGGTWHWAQGDPPGVAIPAAFLAVSLGLLLLFVRVRVHRRIRWRGSARRRLLLDDLGQVVSAAGAIGLLAFGFWPAAFLVLVVLAWLGLSARRARKFAAFAYQ